MPRRMRWRTWCLSLCQARAAKAAHPPCAGQGNSLSPPFPGGKKTKGSQASAEGCIGRQCVPSARLCHRVRMCMRVPNVLMQRQGHVCHPRGSRTAASSVAAQQCSRTLSTRHITVVLVGRATLELRNEMDEATAMWVSWFPDEGVRSILLYTVSERVLLQVRKECLVLETPSDRGTYARLLPKAGLDGSNKRTARVHELTLSKAGFRLILHDEADRVDWEYLKAESNAQRSPHLGVCTWHGRDAGGGLQSHANHYQNCCPTRVHRPRRAHRCASQDCACYQRLHAASSSGCRPLRTNPSWLPQARAWALPLRHACLP